MNAFRLCVGMRSGREEDEEKVFSLSLLEGI